MWTTIRAALVAPLVLAASASHGALFNLTFSNVTFEDGGSVSGSLLFDPIEWTPLTKITTYDVRVSGGNTDLFPPFEYVPGNSDTFTDLNPSPPFGGPRSFVFAFFTGPLALPPALQAPGVTVFGREVQFEVPETVFESVVPITLLPGGEQWLLSPNDESAHRSYSPSSQMIATAVPEPSIALVVLGCGVALFLWNAAKRSN